ncbi:uncharacterized protein [Rutidosis leptorrhynchoides]|uniref:uncharacterized protein n=1 Tax=Rutidosis leptorrhynchoides TaxID=125765 RepID=UPI003A993342
MVAEGMNALIKQAIGANLFNGMKVGVDKVEISHLQYADDTIILGDWNKKNVSNIFKVLKYFENFSGQRVNLAKSCIYGLGLQKETVENIVNKYACQLVSKGDCTRLWLDLWIDSKCLSSWFGRLFNLESQKEVMTEEKIIRDGTNITFNWNRIRPPTSRTSTELIELTELIKKFKFADGVQDRWSWNLHDSGVFSTLILAKLIDSKLLPLHSHSSYTSRLRSLPQKVVILVWRIKHQRFLVRVELDKRGINLDSVLCPVCNNDI